MPTKVYGFNPDKAIEYITTHAIGGTWVEKRVAIKEFCKLPENRIADVPSQCVDGLVSFAKDMLATMDVDKSSPRYIGELLGIATFVNYEWDRYDLDRMKEWRLVYDPEGGRLHMMELETFPDAVNLLGSMRLIMSQREADDIGVFLVSAQLDEFCHCHLGMDDKDERDIHRILFLERRITVPNVIKDAAREVLSPARDGEVLMSLQEEHPELNSSVGVL